MKIVKSRFYDSIAVSHSGRTVVITPTAIAVIENGRFAVYRIRDGVRLEPLEDPSDAPLMFVPEPGVASGFVREVRDGKLYVRMGNVIMEIGEVYEI